MQINNRNWDLIITILLIACFIINVKSISIAAPASPNVKTKSSAKVTTGLPDWQVRWDKTVSAAKAEGVVSLYASVSPEMRASLSKAFQSRFGIALEFVSGSGSDIISKLVAEQRAGIYYCDVITSGHSTMSDNLVHDGYLKPFGPVLILPEVTNSKVWFMGAIPYYNEEQSIIGFLANHFSHIMVNTEMVKEGQITSYLDILKPEWKGKILMDMPVVNGPGRNWLKIAGGMFNFDTDKLKTYLQQLSAQDPMIIRDRRLEVEWVAKGKYPVLLGVQTDMYSSLKAKGAPIALLRMKEGSLMTEGPGAVSLMKRAPHPNAAIVYVNWLLSKEGQIAYTKALGSPSARSDVSTEGIDPMFIKISGEKVYVDDEKMEQVILKMVEVAKQALSSQLK